MVAILTAWWRRRSDASLTMQQEARDEIESCNDLSKAPGTPPSPCDAAELAEQLITLMKSPRESFRVRRTVPSPRASDTHKDVDALGRCDTPDVAGVASQLITLMQFPTERASFRRRPVSQEIEGSGDLSPSNPKESPGLQGACTAEKMRFAGDDEAWKKDKVGEESVPHLGALSLDWLNAPRHWLGAPEGTLRLYSL